jgi:hypothetical protein
MTFVLGGLVVLLSLCYGGYVEGFTMCRALVRPMSGIRRFTGTSCQTKSAEDSRDSVPSVPIIEVNMFPGLKPTQFAHKLDVDIRAYLATLPFLESLARQLYRNVEQAMVLRAARLRRLVQTTDYS